MPIIESRVDTRSETFRANRVQMLALIGDFRALEQKVRDFSNSKRERFRARGQLLPRERVALVLDHGAPWLELMFHHRRADPGLLPARLLTRSRRRRRAILCE